MANKSHSQKSDINIVAQPQNSLEDHIISIHSCNFSYTHTDFARPYGIIDYMLLFTAQGSISYNEDTFNKKRIVSTPEKNNIVFFSPFEPHYFTDASPNLKRYWIHFSAPDIDSVLTKFNIKDNRFFTVSDTLHMEDLITAIMHEHLNKKPHYKLKMTALLYEIIIEIFRSDQYNIPEKSHSIMPALNYIQKEFRNSINIDELAKMCFLSKYYFVKSFKRYTGTTPYAYLTNVRMTCAKDLLRCTDAKINEISNMVGYDDPLHFSRTFKKINSISPSEYRKKCLKDYQKINFNPKFQ